jgi:hypothetical protein
MESGILKTHYTHFGLDEAEENRGHAFQVYLGAERVPNCPDPLKHALLTMRLAVELGVKPPAAPKPGQLPYSEDTDNLLFEAPLTSLLAGRRIKLLRGWKQYGSCVKGFNALGLIAEHAFLELKKLEALTPAQLKAARLGFLRSRAKDGKPVFTESELSSLSEEDLKSVELLHAALWRAYGRRMIVCSTSSNMGISLHEALRYMQWKENRLLGKIYSILNENEGELIIWAPDEQADFMNPEKTEKLRALEAEKPRLTVLHTYINRKQRDPGALKDALNSGGYFFPTNPQSPEEMQNLLSISLSDIAKDRNVPFEEVLLDPNVRQALESLGASIANDRVAVRAAVEGGLYGLATPYFIMLEESLLSGETGGVSTWNQASIGAALAAIVQADMTLREGPEAAAALEPELSRYFPRLADFLKTHSLGSDLLTRIHGLFDIANLQSLAQLFGVTVTRHLSGRGTAFVGLGSSSYANGNRCFDILKQSADIGGSFEGKDGLHPLTHSLNPLSQALVYAEDFARAASSPEFEKLSLKDKISLIQTHAVKPEPAGAAAMTGYLLTRLDAGTLSFFEIAYALRLAGFTRETLLEFGNYGRDEQAENRFIQEAIEEGEYMESLARGLMRVMDWDIESLELRAAKERAHSRLAYRWSSVHTDAFEARNSAVNIYLTGDNCAQPAAGLVQVILESHEKQRARLNAALAESAAWLARSRGFDAVRAVKRASGALTGALSGAQSGLDRLMRKTVQPAINRMVRDDRS